MVRSIASTSSCRATARPCSSSVDRDDNAAMAESPALTLLGPLFASAAMAAAFNDRARLQGMLDFEAALARAEASIGLFPSAAAESVAQACRADLFDIAALARDTVPAGNPAIPMVRQLTALVAKHDPAAAHFVHW